MKRARREFTTNSTARTPLLFKVDPCCRPATCVKATQDTWGTMKLIPGASDGALENSGFGSLSNQQDETKCGWQGLSDNIHLFDL